MRRRPSLRGGKSCWSVYQMLFEEGVTCSGGLLKHHTVNGRHRRPGWLVIGHAPGRDSPTHHHPKTNKLLGKSPNGKQITKKKGGACRKFNEEEDEAKKETMITVLVKAEWENNLEQDEET